MISMDVQRAMEQLSARAEQMARELRDLSVTETDWRGLVTVTCGPGGRIMDIAFDPKSIGVDREELRAAVLDAVERASAVAHERLGSLVSDFSGQAAGLGGDAVRRAREQMAQFNQVLAEQQQKLTELRASLDGSR